ncbi:MAG: hypothetical protein BWY77_00921 [bacterium ADurb.Bin431]|nr:MAG: hypothetical protein BWY77_00921 [bacterium ADurb.Bin431]
MVGGVFLLKTALPDLEAEQALAQFVDVEVASARVAALGVGNDDLAAAGELFADHLESGLFGETLGAHLGQPLVVIGEGFEQDRGLMVDGEHPLARLVLHPLLLQLVDLGADLLDLLVKVFTFALITLQRRPLLDILFDHLADDAGSEGGIAAFIAHPQNVGVLFTLDLEVGAQQFNGAIAVRGGGLCGRTLPAVQPQCRHHRLENAAHAHDDGLGAEALVVGFVMNLDEAQQMLFFNVELIIDHQPGVGAIGRRHQKRRDGDHPDDGEKEEQNDSPSFLQYAHETLRRHGAVILAVLNHGTLLVLAE